MSRRWIVTGGSRGVGLATAQLAIRKGDRVAVLARNIDDSRLREQLGANALAITADITDPEQVRSAVERVAGEWGGVDVLVNNAGLHRGRRLHRLELDDWHAVLDTNLSGPMHCIRACLAYAADRERTQMITPQ